ncbi:MAG: hypothetical protein IPO65_16725 [Saprospiraceae bacterium]|nr:hypothetical protein [Saprospiraceae bacterium]
MVITITPYFGASWGKGQPSTPIQRWHGCDQRPWWTRQPCKNVEQGAATCFGSGWAWLYLTTDKKLAVCTITQPGQPIMDVSPFRGIPILRASMSGNTPTT